MNAIGYCRYEPMPKEVTHLLPHDKWCPKCGFYFDSREPQEASFHRDFEHEWTDVFVRATGPIPNESEPACTELLTRIQELYEGAGVFFSFHRAYCAISGWGSLKEAPQKQWKVVFSNGSSVSAGAPRILQCCRTLRSRRAPAEASPQNDKPTEVSV